MGVEHIDDFPPLAPKDGVAEVGAQLFFGDRKLPLRLLAHVALGAVLAKERHDDLLVALVIRLEASLGGAECPHAAEGCGHRECGEQSFRADWLHVTYLRVFEQLLFRNGFGHLPADNDLRHFERRITRKRIDEQHSNGMARRQDGEFLA